MTPAVSAKEMQILGPPGTGKTTYLADQVAVAVGARGSGEVMIASFTKAAAAEIGSRELVRDNLEDDRVGTLHSHCYRAIGKPKIADDKIEEFMSWQKATLGAIRYEMAGLQRSINDPFNGTVLDKMQEDIEGKESGVRPSRQDTEDRANSETSGDRLYSMYQVLRAKMAPRDSWPTSVRSFATMWEQWKTDTSYIDFTDMIGIAYRDVDRAPGDPSIGFFDESQDLNPLQLALVRKWGERMDAYVLAGDDDQTIYTFTGATPGTFTREIAPERRRILDQSHRVPGHVLNFADAWIKRLGERRTLKDYKPRREIVGKDDRGRNVYGDVVPGAVVLSMANWLTPRTLIEAIKVNLDKGETTMVLASCSYMLDPIRHGLRDRGIPFHNPFRKSRGDWNPLQASRGISTSARILSYYKPDPSVWGDEADWWTGNDLRNWTDLIRAKGLLKFGSKKIIESMGGNYPLTDEQLDLIFEEGALERLVENPSEVLRDHMRETKRKVAGFPLDVLHNYGASGLRDEPKVILGTIHSVKGGEAQHVILFPDISRLAGDAIISSNAAERRDALDSLIRQFYVGITRASLTVTVCRDGGADKVDLYNRAARFALDSDPA